jgi:hypothetical protein
MTKNSYFSEGNILAYHTHKDNIINELIIMVDKGLVEKETRGGKAHFRKRFDENKPCRGE